MTIRLSHELSRDLRANSGWPLFSASKNSVTQRVALCASTVTWESDTNEKKTLQENATIGAAYRLVALAADLSLSTYAYLATGTLQQNSAVRRHWKIWSSPGTTPVPVSVQKWPEKVTECGSQIRLATIVKVPAESTRWMLGLHDFSEVAVPLLLPKDFTFEDQFIDELTCSAFPPDGCCDSPDFEWPSFAAAIAGLNGISIRRTNEYEHRRIAVDYFSACELADRIAVVVRQEDKLRLVRSD